MSEELFGDVIYTQGVIRTYLRSGHQMLAEGKVASAKTYLEMARGLAASGAHRQLDRRIYELAQEIAEAERTGDARELVPAVESAM